MFEPETEDMLPRPAPKPSAAGMAPNENMMQPMVPELSILFGQPPSQPPGAVGRNANVTPPKETTYAAWKKQVLPKVHFDQESTPPLASAAEQPPPTRSALYPLRAASIPAKPNTPPMNAPSSAEYRRNVESPLGQITSKLQQQQRRSLDTMSPRNPGYEILTICAGTQTEVTGALAASGPADELLNKLATKADLSQLCELFESIREEQQRLREICEALLMQPPAQQQLQHINVRDMATQCGEGAPLGNAGRRQISPLMQEFIVEEAEEPLPQPKPLYGVYSPRPPPAAQSTAYRANAPQQQHPQKQQQQQQKQQLPHKSASDKSMVMNELALKYLSNEKLTELMQEMEVSPSAEQQQQQPLPLRGIENFAKAPTDFSNASYKYLKKYRLLPEEAPHAGGQPQQRQPAPYQRDQSPLAGGAQMERYLDLEHIRKQPKFI